MSLREAVARRELLWNLTLRELRAATSAPSLGFGWSLLNPLATMVIFTFVFAYVLKITPAPGDPSGLDVFAAVAAVRPAAVELLRRRRRRRRWASMIDGANLVKKVYFPREHLVFAGVGSLLITHLIELGAARRRAPRLRQHGAAVAPRAARDRRPADRCSSPASASCSRRCNVYFRDLTHLWGIVADGVVLRHAGRLPDRLVEDRDSATLDFVYGLNPMTRFVEAIRDVLYDLRMPTLATFAYLVVMAAVTLVVRAVGVRPTLAPVRRGALTWPTDVAIVVDDVSKRFRLYHERNQYLKAAALRGRRARYEEFWALADVSFEIARARRSASSARTARARRRCSSAWPRSSRPTRARSTTDGTVSALLELGAGFHPELSGRENIYLNGAILGLSKKRDRRPVRRDRRVRRARAVHRHAGQELLVGHVRPARLRGRRQRRSRHPAHRRGARRRRRELPAQVHGEDRRVPTGRPHDRARVPRPRPRAQHVRPGRLARATASCEAIGDPADVINTYSGDRPRGQRRSDVRDRWGSGEARITTIELLDDHGQTVDPLPHRRRRDPAAALQRPPADRPAGVRSGHLQPRRRPRHRTEHPRSQAGARSRSTDRATSMSSFDRLMLLPGTYDVSVSIYDYNVTHCFDTGTRLPLRRAPRDAERGARRGLAEPGLVGRCARGAGRVTTGRRGDEAERPVVSVVARQLPGRRRHPDCLDASTASTGPPTSRSSSSTTRRATALRGSPAAPRRACSSKRDRTRASPAAATSARARAAASTSRFLNNDARPDPGGCAAAVDALRCETTRSGASPARCSTGRATSTSSMRLVVLRAGLQAVTTTQPDDGDSADGAKDVCSRPARRW